MLRATFEFFLKDLAAPLTFYPLFKLYGAKTAIASALAITFIQLAYHRWRGEKPSMVLIVVSGFTIAFGVTDLIVDSPRFFKFQPFLQNFLVASFFLGSVLLGKPLITLFADALPPQLRPRLGGDAKAYLRGVTLTWAAVLYLKALLFLYLSHEVDLGELVALRTVIGWASFTLLIGGELAYRKLIRERQNRPTA